MLQWARANDCPWDNWQCIAAATNDHVEVAERQWQARKCGWPKSGHVYIPVARTHRFGASRYHQAGWNVRTCSFRSRFYFFSTVKFFAFDPMLKRRWLPGGRRRGTHTGD